MEGHRVSKTKKPVSVPEQAFEVAGIEFRGGRVTRVRMRFDSEIATMCVRVMS